MNEKAKITPEAIPYVAYEGTLDRFERSNRRLWVLIIILIVALIASNAAWVYYESQFETVEETVTTITKGEVEQENDNGVNNFNNNNIIGGDGDICDGQTEDPTD